MFRHLSYFPSRLVVAAVSAGLFVAAPSSGHAAVVNKYTFNNGDASDSVGGQNGTLVDATGIAQYTGGMLDLSANNGANSDFANPAKAGAYVDLPNGLINSAVNGGAFGQLTLETWLTVQQNRGWAEAWAFGDQGPDTAEGISNGGNGHNYLALIPQSGTNPAVFRATTRNSADLENNIDGNPSTPLPVNVKHHIVLTLDLFDSTAGPNGTAKLYLNNGAPATAEIAAFFDQVTDVNNWLGRSLWGGDALFDGFIDEFRIHDTALTAEQVGLSFTAGPEPAPFPVLVVNRDTGAVSIANQSGSAIQLKGYSLTSDAGSFNPATWTSIDAGNVFDPDGAWTSQSSTAFNLAESNTGGPSFNGGTLAASPNAGSSRGVGTPWIKTPIEDVNFSFTLGDGTTGNGIVQYTGTAVSRSDLNGDGSINVADWASFVPNSYKTFTGDSLVAAYKKGDLDGDLDNDYFDFQLFKADYIAANGLEAFAALGAVPEPNSVILLTCVAAFAVGVRRR